jgi:hypothetical protein
VHVAQNCVAHGSGEEISEGVGVFEDDSGSWRDSAEKLSWSRICPRSSLLMAG